MKAIITVIGKDKVGIVSAISLELAKLNINILDISQTIMDENFTMIMLVDLNKSTNSFEQIKNILTEVSDKLNISIMIQREEIFKSMHTI
ncbi:ACT domain-containing protein [Clostridium baratii]|uniref:ACT domain-containing protein n=1 Tax=Clostridium baratii TaxID=1561 RepID=UPI0036F2DDA9